MAVTRGRRWLGWGLGGLTFALSCKSTQPLGELARWSEGQCLVTLTIDHADSPLHELRELGGWRDDFQARFPAAVIDPSVQRPVGATANLVLGEHPIAWYAVALDAVVLDGTAFAPLRRADPTRMAAGEQAVVGRVTAKAREALGARGVVELLMRIGAIQTYWHKGANLCLKAERGSEPGGETVYRSDWQAVHHYETNARNEAKYAFAVELHAEGAVVVTGAGDP